jgi:hypothetical protein
MQCITQEEGCELLAEVHRGECGNHTSSRTLVGKAFQHDFYWPTALQDVVKLVKTYMACQFHVKKIYMPVQTLQMIPSLWPFALRGLDIVGPIPPRCRRLSVSLCHHRQVHQVVENDPRGQNQQAICSEIYQIYHLPIWGPEQDYHQK